jgi:hypothetical protein
MGTGYDGGVNTPAPLPQQPSACHAESRQAELERTQKMTVEERIKMALTMDTRFAGLQPTPRKG